MTGLTLPGMIDEPGCRSGIAISPSPARGPEPIQRRSLADLVQAHRDHPQHAAGLDQRVPAACRLEMVPRLGERQLHRRRQPRDRPGGEAGRRVEPGPDRGPAEGQLTKAGEDSHEPFGAMTDGRRVPAELLSEGHRHGVHQMGPSDLDHRGELVRP